MEWQLQFYLLQFLPLSFSTIEPQQKFADLLNAEKLAGYRDSK
jgi:hypothetical protein